MFPVAVSNGFSLSVSLSYFLLFHNLLQIMALVCLLSLGWGPFKCQQVRGNCSGMPAPILAGQIFLRWLPSCLHCSVSVCAQACVCVCVCVCVHT